MEDYQRPNKWNLASCVFDFGEGHALKSRPVLICKVLTNSNDGTLWVYVTPGSANKSSDQLGYNNLLPHQIEISADIDQTDGSHLNENTVFDFSLSTHIRYNCTNFKCGSRKSPVFGSLPQKHLMEIEEAFKYGELEIKQQEQYTPSQEIKVVPVVIIKKKRKIYNPDDKNEK